MGHAEDVLTVASFTKAAAGGKYREAAERILAKPANPWRYVATDGLPVNDSYCDIAVRSRLLPSHTFGAANVLFSEVAGCWRCRDGDRLPATHSLGSVYAWRYSETIEPAPLPEGAER